MFTLVIGTPRICVPNCVRERYSQRTKTAVRRSCGGKFYI